MDKRYTWGMQWEPCTDQGHVFYALDMWALSWYTFFKDTRESSEVLVLLVTALKV